MMSPIQQKRLVGGARLRRAVLSLMCFSAIRPNPGHDEKLHSSWRPKTMIRCFQYVNYLLTIVVLTSCASISVSPSTQLYEGSDPANCEPPHSERALARFFLGAGGELVSSPDGRREADSVWLAGGGDERQLITMRKDDCVILGNVNRKGVIRWSTAAEHLTNRPASIKVDGQPPLDPIQLYSSSQEHAPLAPNTKSLGFLTYTGDIYVIPTAPYTQRFLFRFVETEIGLICYRTSEEDGKEILFEVDGTGVIIRSSIAGSTENGNERTWPIRDEDGKPKCPPPGIIIPLDFENIPEFLVTSDGLYLYPSVLIID